MIALPPSWLLVIALVWAGAYGALRFAGGLFLSVALFGTRVRPPAGPQSRISARTRLRLLGGLFR